MLRGAEKGDERPQSGELGIGKGYGSTGMLEGEMAEGREAGWCELVWFSTNLGKEVGWKEEGEVLRTAQLWFLLVRIFFPFPSGKVPLPCVWEGSWPAPRGKTQAGCLLSPLQPPVSR